MSKGSLMNKIYRHSNRYFEILEVISGHGFAELISSSKITSYLNQGKSFILRKEQVDIENYTVYERIRMILEKLGPTFIKLGQVLSSRSDLIPPELITELEKLQNSVKPFESEKAMDMIREDLNRPVEELFADFDKEPLAAASISQVHRAVLKNGSKVIVKVMRPGIEEKVETDVEIMLHLAGILEKHSEDIAAYNLVSIVKEFREAINKEMDFNNEILNIERFRENFRSDASVYVPESYREFSGNYVLTMEYIDGVKISDTDELEKNGFDLKKIAHTGVDAILRQVFEHGFFHADPHPGNIFVIDDDVISFIDFGMMGVLTGPDRDSFSNIIIGTVQNDAKRVTRALLKLSPLQDQSNLKSFERQVSEFIDKYYYRPVSDLNMVDVLNDLFRLFRNNGLKMPSNIYLLARATVLAQSLGMDLDPDFNISKYLEKYTHKLVRKRYLPGRIFKEGLTLGNDLWRLLLELPVDVQEIINRIKQGKLKIDIEHKGFESLLKTHERVSNKISFSVVLASIIIGSSLIIVSGIPPLIYGISAIGIIGYLTALIFGFWLIISILRHGKM